MAGYIGSAASVVSSGAENKKTFTITGATTSLTGLNYTVGKVHVFQNGVRLVDGTDYTATNGTTITLTVAAQSGDNVVVISQAAFQVALSGIDDQSNAVAMTIDSNENIGIGTSSPSKKAHLYASNDAASLRLENTANSKVWDITPARPGVANTGLSIYNVTDDRTDLHVDNSGNVGFSDTNPQSRLHVRSDNTGFVASNGAGIKGIQVSRSSNNGENLYMYTTSDAGWSGSSHIGRLENYGNNVLEIGAQNAAPISFGTNNTERMKIDGSGRVTMPYQPAFDAYRSSGSYASGSTVTSMDLNSTRLNVGGHYNTASNSLRFTAPVGGVYQFNFRTIINGAYVNGHVKLVKNGVDLQGTDTHFTPTGSAWSQVLVQIIVALNANDYMQVRFQNNYNIYGNSYESFNGHLIG
jgi:hypothetical protein